MIIDAKGMIAGRLASKTAKKPAKVKAGKKAIYQNGYINDDPGTGKETGKQAGKETGTYQEVKRNTPSISPPYPDWLNIDLWNDFKEHRKGLKPKMTERAEQLAIKKLKRLMDEGNDQRELIEQTIENGWKSFFPVKQRRKSLKQEDAPPYWQEVN